VPKFVCILRSETDRLAVCRWMTEEQKFKEAYAELNEHRICEHDMDTYRPNYKSKEKLRALWRGDSPEHETWCY
jgi:hypothetical protein